MSSMPNISEINWVNANLKTRRIRVIIFRLLLPLNTGIEETAPKRQPSHSIQWSIGMNVPYVRSYCMNSYISMFLPGLDSVRVFSTVSSLS